LIIRRHGGKRERERDLPGSISMVSRKEREEKRRREGRGRVGKETRTYGFP
jgi:hypothetical protein